MAYDEDLAARIRTVEGGLAEKKMFGGIAFLLNGNMAVGVSGDELMVRVGKDDADAALAEPGTRPFEMSGKSMAGWILVGGDAIGDEDSLARWVDTGVSFAAGFPPK